MATTPTVRTAQRDDVLPMTDANGVGYRIIADSERGCLVVTRGGEEIAAIGEDKNYVAARKRIEANREKAERQREQAAEADADDESDEE